jgi:hypothetical protein
MAASPIPIDGVPPQENWGPPDDQNMGPTGETEGSNSGPNPADDHLAGDGAENSGYPRGSSVGDVSLSGSKNDAGYREKQVKVLRSLPVSCIPALSLFAILSDGKPLHDVLLMILLVLGRLIWLRALDRSFHHSSATFCSIPTGLFTFCCPAQ